MDEERIARIIELEGTAVRPEKIASATRWETAHLYWDEVKSGTSQSSIAKRVEKSQPHISYMCKAWDTIALIFSGDYESLPEFAEVYRSSDVRGQSAGGERRKESGREPRPRPRPPETVHEWVNRVCGLAAKIRAYPDGITASEARNLRHAIRSLERAIGPDEQLPRPGRAIPRPGRVA